LEASLARKIFKANEVEELKSKVLITPPHLKKAVEEEPVEEVEELEAPQELEEAELAPSVPVEEERDRILEEAEKVKQEAETEAKRIKDEAEEAAFKVMQKNSIEARKIKEEAEEETKRFHEEAEEEAEKIINEAKGKAEAIIQEAKSKAFEEGRDEGFNTGKEEVERLIERLHVILNAAIDKRRIIIENTERQLVDLVLLIARKVIKVISEAERKVVIENIKEALKKVRKETEITIRVNIEDIDLTTKNKKRFISLVEGLEHITIEEDSRVDPGGCIIETSFGDIDARIATQLNVLEEKIRDLMPVQG
jgi:flagellar assembly protein FliH